MLLANIKLGIFSGLPVALLTFGEYSRNTRLLSDIILIPLVVVLILLSLFVVYRSYEQIKAFKKVSTHYKYLQAVQSGNISKLRRLVLSNPVEAANHIVIVKESELKKSLAKA